ncbi:phage tail tape measure protein [Streptomyces marokkonensis]|uniref:phage tail tape measure protein n=1 Tax=Streptomyces marokkonensis TaxID=324855 RepID=UPI0011F34F06|nr:phage tail tape measure protein [Streptomyces marokkonensis]
MPNVGYATISIIPSVRGIADDLRRQLVAPAADAGGQAGEAAGGGLRDGLKAGAAAAAAAAGALLVKGLGDALDHMNVSSKLQAQLGASGKDAAKYGKVAGKLYSSGVTDSFQGAADAIKSVMQSGIAPPGATNQQLQQIATKASDVASIFGQDLGGVTNAVSQMMRTGLAKSSTEAFDLITAGFQGGTDKAGDFLDTINEYGVQFQKAGLDGASAIGLLNQAIAAGARDSDVAADAIKEFSIRAVDGSKTSADGFKMLGLNADDMAKRFAKGGSSANAVLDLTLDRLRGIKDPVKQSQIAVQLFGTQAEDLGKALFAMDPSKAAKGLGDVGGAAKKAGDTIRSGPSHTLTLFTRSLQKGLVDVVGTYVVPALTKMAGAARSAFGWLRDNQGWVLPLAAGLGTLAASIGLYVAVTRTASLVTRGWAAAQALFNAVMAVNPFVLVIGALVALGVALFVAWKKSETFRSIVKAVWQAVQNAALWAWNNVLKPTFEGIKSGLTTLGGWFKWLWDHGVKPAFNGIKSTISTVYSVGIKPVFDKLKTATGKVADAFGVAKDGIKKAWDQIKGIAKAPVKFVIDTVYNNGVVKVWNAVADKFGAPTLDPIKGFATGGVLPGYTPGRDVHLAALSGGEAVMRPEWTRAVGPGYVNTMNAAARSGGVSAIRRMVSGGMPAFADGGIFGWVKNAASKGVDLAKGGFDWLKDGIKASAVAGLNKIVKPLIDKIAGSASVYRDMISGVPKRMIKAIVSFSGEADKKMEALGIGGGSFKSALSFARAQSGKPYIWGGVGPTGYDCSGFMSAIENVIRGMRPYSRRWATMAFSGSRAASGWTRNRKSPFMVGITNAGVGHTAGTLNGVNVESRGGDGVVVGKRARGYNSSLFTDWYGFKYDAGGWLQPGQAGVNHLGEPEAVLTPAQSTAFVRMAAAAAQLAAQPARTAEPAGATVGGFAPGQKVRLVVRDREFDAFLEEVADGRIAAGFTAVRRHVKNGPKR